MMFYNRVTEQWMDAYQDVDTWWFGIWENDWDASFCIEFSSQSIFRCYTAVWDGGVEDFKVLEGEVSCCSEDESVQNDDFSGVEWGQPPDTARWESMDKGGNDVDKAVIDQNKLTWNDSASTNIYTWYRTVWEFCDTETAFDARMSFNFDEMSGGSGSTGPYIRLAILDDTRGNWYNYIEIQNSPSFGLRYQPRTNYLVGTPLSAGAITSGKLRIAYSPDAHPDSPTRETVTFWYWNDVAEQWEYDGDTDGLSLPIDALSTQSGGILYIGFGNNLGTATNLRIDNFQVTTGPIPTSCLQEAVIPGALNIRRAQVSADDRGTAEIHGRAITKSVQLMMFGSEENANWAADRAARRAAYPFAEGQITLNREGFKYEVGDLFRLSDSEHDISNMACRVMQTGEGSLEDEKINISFMEEPDYTTQSAALANVSTTGTQRDYGLDPLVYVAVIEAPYSLVEESIKIIPLASREKGTEVGYELWVSIDGTSYAYLDDVTYYGKYGTLVSELSIDVLTLDKEIGFEVDFVFDDDASTIETITRTQLFNNGNMALLGDELLNFETITPDAVIEGRYAISGLSRARFDSVRKTWPASTPFWVLGTTAIKTMSSTAFLKGATLYFKMIPYNDHFIGEISEAIATNYTFVGRSRAPYVPGNLNKSGVSKNATYGHDIYLTWDPRVRGLDAGISDPDSVIDYTPSHEGKFEIEVRDSVDALVRTATEIDIHNWTYTKAMNLADNVTLEDSLTFQLDNYNVTDGVTYTNIHSRTLEVTRVSTTTTTTTV
jgi:hypothetical protein